MSRGTLNSFNAFRLLQDTNESCKFTADMSLPLPEETLVAYNDTVAPMAVDRRIFEATTSIGRLDASTLILWA